MTYLVFFITVAILLLALIFTALNARILLSGFSSVSFLTITALLFIVLAAALLRFYRVPPYHNVYYDEFYHQDIGRRASIKPMIAIDYYTSISNPRLKIPKWGPGFYPIQAVWYKLFGSSEEDAFMLNRTMSTLTVLLAFFTGSLILNSHAAGLWFAFLLCIYPLHLRFTYGLSIEIASLPFQLASLALVTLFLRTGERKLFWVCITVCTCYSLVRIDNALLGVPLALICTHYYYSKLKPTAWKRGLAFSAFLMLLVLIQGYDSARMEFRSHYHNIEMPNYLIENIAFWFTSNLQPWILTLLGLTGIFMLGRTNRPMSFGLAVIFALYLMLYSFVHRVNFLYPGFERFALLFSIILLIPASHLLSKLQDAKPFVALALAASIVFFSYSGRDSLARPFRKSLNEELIFLRGTKDLIPKGALLFSEVPVFHRVVQQVEAYHTGALLREDKELLYSLADRGVYLYKPLLSSLVPGRTEAVFNAISKNWQLEPIKEKLIDATDMPRNRPAPKLFWKGKRLPQSSSPEMVAVAFYRLRRLSDQAVRTRPNFSQP